MKYPDTFRLRSGAGQGRIENGLCFMETVALIAGEPITDYPKCASPVLTSLGIQLNDGLPEDCRQRLLPLAVSMAGTRSTAHERERIEILGRAACRIAKVAADLTDNPMVRLAVRVTDAFWDTLSIQAAAEATQAADAASAAARSAECTTRFAESAAARTAAKAAQAAWITAEGNADHWAAEAVGGTARAAETTANFTKPCMIPEIQDMAIAALQEAINAGPHSALSIPHAQARFDLVSDRLPVRVVA
ncbi:MAG: hypothetical protein AAGF88_01045 [Pseudomonadota bacterium]